MGNHTTPDRFRAWIARAGIERADIADRLGISQPHVRHLVLGTRSPSLALATRIQALTGIPATDWVKNDGAAA